MIKAHGKGIRGKDFTIFSTIPIFAAVPPISIPRYVLFMMIFLYTVDETGCNFQGACDSSADNHSVSTCLKHFHGLVGIVYFALCDYRNVQGFGETFYKLGVRSESTLGE